MTKIALMNEKHLLHALLENSPDYIFFRDRQSRFVLTNDAHARLLLGLDSAREAIGKSDFDLFRPEEAQRFYNEEQKIMETGEPVIAREWTLTSSTSGQVVWLSEHKLPIRNETGQVIGLLGLSRDITQIKQAEAERERLLTMLEHRNVQLQTAADISTVASGILDPEVLIQRGIELIRERFDLYYVGLFLVAPPHKPSHEPGRWAQLQASTGEVGSELIQQQQLAVGGTSLIGQCIAGRKACMATTTGEEPAGFAPPLPETRAELALPLITRGAAIGALTIQSAPGVAFTEGDIAVFQTIANQLANAIENARLFQETQQAKQAAEKADRIKTRLLANVSHELRTPLNIILGYAQDAPGTLNPYGITPPPALLDDLEHIRSSAEHQLRIINDLLDLSRADIDELDLYLELLDPSPLLHNAFQSIACSAPDSAISWQLHLPDRLPLIQADPVRLRQVLINLLSNARKFTDHGQIVLGAQVAPPHLHLWVADTGVGISPDMQDRIFEPFVTAEHPGHRAEGIGLGLSITRRLVALHNGSMQLDSEPGRGSTFHVYLPLPNLADKIVPDTTVAQPALLLITATDQPSAEMVAVGRCQGLDIQCLHPGDDLDAVLRRVQPAALAWDLSQAGAGDWATVRRLRNHPHVCQLPFILYGPSASSDRVIGPTGVVAKPASTASLLNAINALCPQEMAGPILVVDDNPVTCQTHRDVIADGLPGYPICTAHDGAAALAAMEGQTPSLVVLDLMMPKMDGFDVLDWMRADPRTQAVPVVILTSKVLSLDDVKRIEKHAHVVVQSKGVLSDDEIIAALHRALFGAETLPPQTGALVKRALAYMHQNYARPLARWEIAEAIGVSDNYLSRVFHQELGLSPWDYLNRFRISHAQELFRRTQDSVKRVAAQVGFKDAKYFSRVFHKLTGLSPSEFREHPPS
ncbi:MAG: helix-turn-helix domain-containing protein [Anaerolineae bacterium]|nr:helix-turn-helix domain-containing protein [Anaerolineae bacterium]